MARTADLTKKFRRGLGDATHQNIRHLMINIAGNPVKLLEVVAGGAYHWRLNFLRDFRGLAVDENVADAIFKFFCQKVVDHYGPDAVAGALLDAIEVMSPPSQKDIDEGWTLDIASSDEAMRMFYEGTARTRHGLDMGVKPDCLVN